LRSIAARIHGVSRAAGVRHVRGERGAALGGLLREAARVGAPAQNLAHADEIGLRILHQTPVVPALRHAQATLDPRHRLLRRHLQPALELDGGFLDDGHDRTRLAALPRFLVEQVAHAGGDRDARRRRRAPKAIRVVDMRPE
jgi:hypothetical protein